MREITPVEAAMAVAYLALPGVTSMVRDLIRGVAAGRAHTRRTIHELQTSHRPVSAASRYEKVAAAGGGGKPVACCTTTNRRRRVRSPAASSNFRRFSGVSFRLPQNVSTGKE